MYIEFFYSFLLYYCAKDAAEKGHFQSQFPTNLIFEIDNVFLKRDGENNYIVQMEKITFVII